MYLTSKVKQEIFKDNGNSPKDTGSAEGQIALFTHRINHLTNHLKSNKKDFTTQKSLLKLGCRIGKKPFMYEISRLESIDIDTSEDWELAEAISSYMKSKPKKNL